jgi:hypothetical protein
MTEFAWCEQEQFGHFGFAYTPALRLRSGQSGSVFDAAVIGPAEAGPYRLVVDRGV